MSELKVEIPAGYRWVEPGEKRDEATTVWKSQQRGYWLDTTLKVCPYSHHVITPILPPKPETVDVPITVEFGMLSIDDPNDGIHHYINNAPCIVGPEWAFAGFVWADPYYKYQGYCHVCDNGVLYAKAVRFRRVNGGAK